MRRFLTLLMAVPVALAFTVAPAFAEAPSAWFHLASVASPGRLQPGGGKNEIVVRAVNIGDATTAGAPVTLLDRLPQGLRAVSAEGNSFGGGNNSRGPVQCALKSAREVQCPLVRGPAPREPGTLAPFEQMEVVVAVALEPGAASGEVNEASISGGDAPTARIFHPITLGKAGEATPFGVEDYALSPEEAGGTPDAQAGSHPFQLTTTLDLNEGPGDGPAELAKDVTFKLPAGLIGNPTAFPHCTMAQFTTFIQEANHCPAGSVLGVAIVTYHEESGGGLFTTAVPIFNLEPAPGEAARFGFQPASLPVFLSASVRTGEDYGVTVHVSNILETVGFVANTVVFWGVPGDARHDNARDYDCLDELYEVEARYHGPCAHLESSSTPPFLSLPTSCTGGPLETEVFADSWAQPGIEVPPAPDPSVAMPSMDGCGLLPFGSEIKVSSDVQNTSSPSGLRVDVHVPQEEALSASGLAPTDLRTIQVTLPEGVQLNPSAADGLEACSEAQVGLDNAQESSCPNASKIATATIHTPLLPNPLTGFVYLAAPQNFAGLPPENPFSKHVAMYLVVKDPVSGVLVKLAGSVELGGEPGVTGLTPGQIRATFANNPQLPFEDAELEFFGGERAPLATPALCRRPGEAGYRTSASFEPWTNTETLHETLSATSEFDIINGPGGAPCPNAPGDQAPGSLPFNASLSSETTNINAGGFTPLSTTLSRPSGTQNISSVTLHYPPGVSGLLSGVALCPEAQANEGTCGQASEIGETIVSVGVGGEPFTVTGGKVYITEKYDGAPFGLSIVNPAKAGPFDLQEGRPVVVRAKIEVNPITAALTIATNSASEGHAIPTLIEGFALQIQHVNVLINRPGFTFNPTNCTPAAITGQIDSSEGASTPVSVPFQVTNCSVLAFKPGFKATTSAKTSRTNGESLHVAIVYPNAPHDTQANIKSVKVDLPKQLPSRLTTLQKACVARVFEANPSACPAASRVGSARAVTPLLPVPLEGPAYFVSYGDLKFPELIIVLQGYGVTIYLHGETFISKQGITSSTFRTVPDQPVGSFELTLPQGKFSALASNGNLCKVKGGLKMPTALTAQNGIVIKQSTPISVTGCPKPKKASKSVKHSKKSAHKKKK
jgi:hypothetical protein